MNLRLPGRFSCCSMDIIICCLFLMGFLQQAHAAASKKPRKYDTAKYAKLCVPDGKRPLASSDRRSHNALQKMLEMTSTLSLEMKEASQHKAACWMLYDDPRRPSPSSVSFMQRYVLATFWFGTAGSTKWLVTDDWMSKKDECSWYGIHCTRSWTGSKHVTGLDLGFNEVTGLLPRELAFLTHMEDVDLHGNEIQGVLPNSILASWKQLKILRLHMNGLFGQMPAEIGLLTNLRELHVFGNYFQGPIPKELEKLVHLEKLDLYANNFSGKIPTNLGKLRRLQELDVHDNDLTGRMPQAICDIRPKVLTSDCLGRQPEVRCDCCTICCQGLPDLKCVDVATGKEIGFDFSTLTIQDSKRKKSTKKKKKV